MVHKDSTMYQVMAQSSRIGRRTAAEVGLTPSKGAFMIRGDVILHMGRREKLEIYHDFQICEG